MSAMSTTSLASAIAAILERIGSDDFGAVDVVLPDSATPECVALEQSLRSLIVRYQKLEEKAKLHSANEAVKERHMSEHLRALMDRRRGFVCSSCGSRLNGVPLTPEETPSVDDATSMPNARILSRDFDLTSTNYVAEPTFNGYESSTSDASTISVLSTEAADDTIVDGLAMTANYSVDNRKICD